jgi:hypothetical protein
MRLWLQQLRRVPAALCGVGFAVLCALIYAADCTHREPATAGGLAQPADSGVHGLPASIETVEDQHEAMSILFSVARAQYAKGSSPIRPNAREIRRAVGIAVAHAARPDSTEALEFVFARTCEYYSAASTTPPGSGNANAYSQVFDDAVWDSCEKLAGFPGRQAHEYLVTLAVQYTGDPAMPISDLVTSQESLR